MTFREEFWDAFSKIEISRDLLPEKAAEKLNEIEARLRPHLPKSVFKYRSCNSRNFDALARNVIYAVPASYMNDPFDGLVYVDIDKIINDIKYGQSREFWEHIKEYGKLPESMEAFLTKESYDRRQDKEDGGHWNGKKNFRTYRTFGAYRFSGRALRFSGDV